MTLSAAYLDRIKKFEGWNPKAYSDYKQHSVGYGTRARYPGEVIDRAEGERRFATEIDNARRQVLGLGVPMTPGQTAALTDLTYNAGPGWMKAGLGAAVRSGNWDDARQRLLQYVNAGGSPLPGLVKRRQMAASWMTGGAPEMAHQMQPTDQGTPMPLMTAMQPQPQQQSGFDLNNILSSPLFLMGASVLGADNIGKGLMGGAQAAQSISQARSREQLARDQMGMQRDMHSARMAQMNDPLARQQREAELALTQAKTQAATRGPQSSVKYGLNPVPFQRPDGTIGYMVPNTAGEARALEIPGGGKALPQASVVQTPTHIITQDKFGRELSRERKDLAGAEMEKKQGANLATLKLQLPKDRNRISSLERGWNIVEQNIQRAREMVQRNPRLVGLLGTLSAQVPGTEAYDLAQVLNTVKSNIGFDKLQDMRANSPTGGALGQVSEFENVLLQATQGSIEQGQSPQQFLFNLNNIDRNYRELKSGVYRAFEESYSPVFTGKWVQPQPLQRPSGNEANFAAPSLGGNTGGFSARRVP